MLKCFAQVFASLRFRLFLLVVLVCAPLAAEIAHSAWEARRSHVADWEGRCRQMLQDAASEESWLIEQTRQLLLAMAESAQVKSGNQQDCKELVSALIRGYPRYAKLAVVKTNGEVLAAAPTQEETPRPTDLQRGAERLIARTTVPPMPATNWFDGQLLQRVLQTRAFATGNFAASLTDDRRTVDFGCPVLDDSGHLQAVVIAALDWVNRAETEQQLRLPAEATWTEVNQSGKILARYPSPESWAGQPFPEPALVETFFTRREGVVEATDPQGVLNFYAFARRNSQLTGEDLVGILGIPKAVLFTGVNRKLVRDLVGLGVAAGLALLLGRIGSDVLVLRRVKTLAKASTRLAAGDFSTRTGLPHGRDELGQLTRAFDQMAQVLERHETERERAKHRLEALSHRLVEAQESERRHIARELHDQIGQALTVAQMNLHAAAQQPNGRDRSLHLKECLAVVENVMDQVHDLSLNLRPSMLDDLGLEPALRWLTEKQASLGDLRFEFRSNVTDSHLTPVIKTECFRVAQEALTNVIRHAKARAVSVELQQDDGILHLRVHDDGVGFDVNSVREQAVRGASLGVLSMEERTLLAGGGLEFKSTLENGTDVHAWFPTRLPVPSAFAVEERV